jgi:hypothetical protein
MEALFNAILTVLGVLFSILTWALWQLTWIVLWLILPVLIVAYIAVRIAENILGREVVRGWLRARSLRIGGGLAVRARRMLLAMSVMPVRVVFWFLIYAVWHSIVSLLWRPKWKPWARAWTKRWRPHTTTRSKTQTPPATSNRSWLKGLRALGAASARGGAKLSSLVTTPSRGA